MVHQIIAPFVLAIAEVAYLVHFEREAAKSKDKRKRNAYAQPVFWVGQAVMLLLFAAVMMVEHI